MIDLLGEVARYAAVVVTLVLWSLAAILGVTQWQAGNGELVLAVACLLAGLAVAALGWAMHRMIAVARRER